MQPTPRRFISNPPSAELLSADMDFGLGLLDLPLDLLNEVMSFLPYPFVHHSIAHVCSEFFHLVRGEESKNKTKADTTSSSEPSDSHPVLPELHCLRNVELYPLLTRCVLESCPGCTSDLADVRCRLLCHFFKNMKRKTAGGEDVDEDADEDDAFALAVSVLQEEVCKGWTKKTEGEEEEDGQHPDAEFREKYGLITSGDLRAVVEVMKKKTVSFWRGGGIEEEEKEEAEGGGESFSTPSSCSCLMQQLPPEAFRISSVAMQRFVLGRLSKLQSLRVSMTSSSDSDSGHHRIDSRLRSVDALCLNGLNLVESKRIKKDFGKEESEARKQLGRLWAKMIETGPDLLRLQKLKIEGVSVREVGLFVKALRCCSSTLGELVIRGCRFDVERCQKASNEGHLGRDSVSLPHLVRLELAVIDEARLETIQIERYRRTRMQDRETKFQTIDASSSPHCLGFLLPIFVCDKLEEFELSGIVGEEKLTVNLVQKLVLRECDNFGLSDEVLHYVRNLTIVRHDERVKGEGLFQPDTLCQKFLRLENLSIDHELGASSGFIQVPVLSFGEREKIPMYAFMGSCGEDWPYPSELFDQGYEQEEKEAAHYQADDYGDYDEGYYEEDDYGSGDSDTFGTLTRPSTKKKTPTPRRSYSPRPAVLPRGPPPIVVGEDPKPYRPKCISLVSLTNLFRDENPVRPHLTSLNLSGSEVTDALLLAIAERYTCLREAVFSNYDDNPDPITNFRFSQSGELLEHRDDRFATCRALTLEGVSKFLVRMQVNLESLILPLVYSVCQRSLFAGVLERYHDGAALTHLEVWGYLFNDEVARLIRSIPIEIVVHGGKLTEYSDEPEEKVFTWRCPMKCGAMGDEKTFLDAQSAKRTHFEKCALCLRPLKSFSIGLSENPRGFESHAMPRLVLPEDGVYERSPSLAKWPCPLSRERASFGSIPNWSPFVAPAAEELPEDLPSDIRRKLCGCSSKLPVAGLELGERNDYFTNCKANVVICGSCADPPAYCRFSELQQHLDSEAESRRLALPDSKKKVFWSITPRPHQPSSIMTRVTRDEMDDVPVVKSDFKYVDLLESEVDGEMYYVKTRPYTRLWRGKNEDAERAAFEKKVWDRMKEREKEQLQLQCEQRNKRIREFAKRPARCFGSLRDEALRAMEEAKEREAEGEEG